MAIVSGTLSRYFGLRFLSAVVAVFAGVFALVALVDFVELMRRSAGETSASAFVIWKTSIFRVPQVTERIMPFAILIGAMSCYLNLSRRLELVVARSAGMSAWQFVAPAVVIAMLLGVAATTIYNPVAATLHERSKRLEVEIFGGSPQAAGLQATGNGFWVRQLSVDGPAIINAQTSSDQGVHLGGVTVFTFDNADHFKERIEAKTATLQSGAWQLDEVRVYATNAPPLDRDIYRLNTNLTREQVRESFSTPETVPFWQLPLYIDIAERSGLNSAGYRLQYYKLLTQPFLLAAMVLLAAAVSLRFFRFGGVQKMVLSGIASGFLLYILSKVTEDLSKAELMSPVTAAWLPVLVGGLTGFVVLLYQEDG
jgi:lipopolysaccharide export system permease protein